MDSSVQESRREPGLDAFRGLAILAMVVANYLEHVQAVPWWLKHKPDVGITPVDFIAPLFIFAIGLSYGSSVRRRREREGGKKTITHVLRRAMALVGIGALFSLGEASYGFNPGLYPWGTLQAIGMAILLSFAFLFIPWPARLAAALGLLAGYQVLLDRFWLEQVIAAPQAGLPGSLSWAVLLILATVFADLLARKKAAWYAGLAILLAAAGAGLSLAVPVSKHRMSASFDLIVTAAGAALYAAFLLSSGRARPSMRPLQVWGANPLVLYVTHLVLLAVFLVPTAPRWHVRAPLWQVAAQGLVFVGLLHLWASWLHRKKVIVSL